MKEEIPVWQLKFEWNLMCAGLKHSCADCWMDRLVAFGEQQTEGEQQSKSSEEAEGETKN